MKNHSKNKPKEVTNAGIAGAAFDTVQRYGSAVKEHIVVYSGDNNETGEVLKKSLNSLSKHKVNPEYELQNLKQQAGFAAESKSVARENAERIINGDLTRRIRTDDLGRVNDPLYDHMDIDANGNPIQGSGTQMKFVGDSPESAWRKLQGNKFQKYYDANAPIEVPSDYYDGIIKEADQNIAALQKKAELFFARGEEDKLAHINESIKKIEDIKDNIRRSNVSSAEAMEARVAPECSTLKDIGKLAHNAGCEAAKYGAAVGGSIAIVQNICGVIKGDIKYSAATKNVCLGTIRGAAIGYGTGLIGSAVKGAMQNAPSETFRALSKTNLPAIMVTVAIETTKTMAKFCRGEITGLQCFNELGQKGTSMVSSAMFAAIGQVAIPIPVVGSLIGSMVGYAMASASYGILFESLNYAALARKERLQVEKECEAHIQMIRAYRKQVIELADAYLQKHTAMFNEAFADIKHAMAIGDIDGFIGGANTITESLGKKSQFKNMTEFDELMVSDEPFTL